MPWSHSVFDTLIEHYVRELQPSSMLDIGAGAGKYGAMARRVSPQTWTVGVEMQSEYVEHFELESIYDEVVVGRAEDIFLDEPDVVTDLVIFGDSIEHMRKSVGVDLLHYFAYRSRCIICVYPTKYVQYSLDGRAAEAHVSVWGPQDFGYFDTEHREHEGMNLALVTGFLADPEATLATDGAQPLGPTPGVAKAS
ncbi:MAG: hypothetical protein AAF799_28010 [Myxococcota bacterium]